MDTVIRYSNGISRKKIDWNTGDGLKFDGVNDYVSIPFSANMSVGTGDFSISVDCVIKNNGNFQIIFENWRGSVGQLGWGLIKTNIDNQLRFGLRGSIGSWDTHTMILPSGKMEKLINITVTISKSKLMSYFYIYHSRHLKTSICFQSRLQKLNQ
jgi:hypothetical protein